MTTYNLQGMRKEKISLVHKDPGEGGKLSGHLGEHVLQEIALLAFLHILLHRQDEQLDPWAELGT